MDKSLNYPPVLFLIFNRPELTKRVFERIRQARPSQLFIAADGPRPKVPKDVNLCFLTRQILDEVDWDCEVHRLFRDKNLGCKSAVSSAITWFFKHVEEGIILEDDCLPNQAFFRYATELLEYYRVDERVMVISGNNFQSGIKRTSYSYYFSRYPHIWGWATWQRAWDFYDGNIALWSELRNTSWLKDILGENHLADYWRNIYDMVLDDKIDSWDYPWTFSCWAQNGLSVLPEVNLVTNIGFGSDATHTKGTGSRAANVPLEEIHFPLLHPPSMIRQVEADQYISEIVYGIQSPIFFSRLYKKKDGMFWLIFRLLSRIITSVRKIVFK